MKNKSLIMLVCILFHTLYISSMDTAEEVTEAQVFADAQTKSDVSSTEVSAQDGSQKKPHWNALSVGNWDVPGGKIGAAVGTVLTLGGAFMSGKAALSAIRSSEPEWAVRFRNLLVEVSYTHDGFIQQWVDYALYNVHDAADDHAKAANMKVKAPHGLLAVENFLEKLNDDQLREFIAILELLEKHLQDNHLRAIISEDQKELLQVKNREDVLKALTSEQRKSLQALQQKLNLHKTWRENWTNSWENEIGELPDY